MKARISNDVPTSRVRTDSPTLRASSDTPISKVRTDSPILRVRTGFGVLAPATNAINWGDAGFLIGMLALTYMEEQTTPGASTTFRSDDVPIVSIRSTD